MAEQNSYTPDEARFGDIYKSRFYQYEPEIQLPGDPETPEDFERAQNYLETITQHLLEFGPVWEKKPQDIIYELDYHNVWHQHEVDQERKAGEKTAEYREITIQALQALSKRRVLAFEEAGWEVTQDYQVICHIDNLIRTAVVEQEQLEQLMAASCPVDIASLNSVNDQAKDVPF